MKYRAHRCVKTNVRLFSLDCPLLVVFSRLHAAKTEMVGAGVDFAFAARADDVARTILLIAKKRAAAMDAFLLVRLSWIKR